MRTFDYLHDYPKLLTPEIVSYLCQIHEFRGQQSLLMKAQPEALAELPETARLQSVEASTKIDGIGTSDDRLKKLVKNKTLPRTVSERAIAGYRDVLTTIHENHAYIPIRPGMILQLHRDLTKYAVPTSSRTASDNTIQKDHLDSLNAICDAYQQAVTTPCFDPLLIIPMFILDFICIHPFGDDNGRMSRLLTLLLLYRSGYIVGRYISIEKAILDSQATYHEALPASSHTGHDGTNDYTPIAQYMLSVITTCCREFSAQAQLLCTRNLSKPDRVREVLQEATGRITKAEIIAKCPDISQITVQRALSELLEANLITKIGGGRYTSYIWNRERNE